MESKWSPFYFFKFILIWEWNFQGKVEVIAALLESGASCNASANNGCSPLHLAAQYGHCKACKLLLEYGADLSARQSDGCSPLDLACEFGREDVSSNNIKMDQLLVFLRLTLMKRIKISFFSFIFITLQWLVYFFNYICFRFFDYYFIITKQFICPINFNNMFITLDLLRSAVHFT